MRLNTIYSVLAITLALALILNPILINSSNTKQYCGAKSYNNPTDPLREYRRPLVGGIKTSTLIGSSTIGYIGYHNGVLGVVIAGHSYFIGCSQLSIRWTYQPTVSSTYYIGTPSLISYNCQDTSVLDAAFIPYSNSIKYVLYVYSTSEDKYSVNNIYIGSYANYYWIEYLISHAGVLHVYKTGFATSTSEIHLLDQTDCDGSTCNTTIGIAVNILPGTSDPVAPGDSGSPVFHCFYNDCSNDADGLLIGILVRGVKINNTWVVAINNAYAIDHYLGISLWRR